MIPELYAKCREIGYCDCNGTNGCIDDTTLVPAPTEAEHERQMFAQAKMSKSYSNHNLKRELAMPSTSGPCEVCGKQLRRNHKCKGAPVAKAPLPIISNHVLEQISRGEPETPSKLSIPANQLVLIEIGDVRVTIESKS